MEYEKRNWQNEDVLKAIEWISNAEINLGKYDQPNEKSCGDGQNSIPYPRRC